MRSEVFEAQTIDEAAQRILKELKEDVDGTDTSNKRHNVIYFDGWDGLGASAVLQAIRQRLTPAAQQGPSGRRAIADGLEFSKILNLDCAKWVSRRAMQRDLAEQLELSTSILEMFDIEDEKDDYHGKDESSRFEIPKVASEIYKHIQNVSRRFLVIFHNGGTEEIDLDILGFPLSGYSRNKALWSFQGRFRVYPRTKVDMALKGTRTTDVFLSATHSPIRESGTIPYFLRQEAIELASQISIGGIDMAAEAVNCFLSMMKVCRMGSQMIYYDLATHGFNYWKCDGIKQLEHGIDDDKLWLYYDALQHEMRLDVDSYQNPYFPSPVAWSLPELPYWSSPTYGIMLVSEGQIPRGIFQQFDKLCVLKLSKCVFSFKTPPFLCCHNLRFLWLDCCTSMSTHEVGKEEDICRFFQRLWVLDMRYSNIYSFLFQKVVGFMTQLKELKVMGDSMDMYLLEGQGHNIRKLRVTKCTPHDYSYRSLNSLLSGKDKLELLEFSENEGIKSLHVESSCSNLVTVIIHGSMGLKEICLKGCAKLKNLFLSGSLPDLYSLDLTGTAVEALDLSGVIAPEFNELFLLDCAKLCFIGWPSADDNWKGYLGRLCIDTTEKDGNSPRRSPDEFYWYISARENHLGSLVAVKDYFRSNYTHLEISSLINPGADVTGDKDGGIDGNNGQQVHTRRYIQLEDNAIYTDIFNSYDTIVQQGPASESDCDALAIMCPPSRQLHYRACYMHIEDQDKKKKKHIQEQNKKKERRIEDQKKGELQSITIPGCICDSARTLLVYDSFSVKCIALALFSSTWNRLESCRVERSPKLESVFSLQAIAERSSSQTDIFQKLKTIWASHLTNARYILNPSGFVVPKLRAFAGLTLLHLYCCPRLVYAVPLQYNLLPLENLETIQITWCGDLSAVFHIYRTNDSFISGPGWWWPNLKHIHLHELPVLRGIYDGTWETMIAPKLETIKIRGCWNLRKLPSPISKNSVVECDCEKEWWDSLEERDRRVMAYCYKLNHPRYYKKTMLKGPLLR